MKTAWMRRVRPGFSLVELLVVLAIIVLVISIIVPALGRVRSAAKKQDTKSRNAELGKAIELFNLDNKRLPGYFTQAEMGMADNVTRGFSQSQNVMLDLAGGVTTEPVGTGVVSAGPMNDATKRVNVAVNIIGGTLSTSSSSSAAGLNKAAYYTPGDKYYKLQDGVYGGEREGVAEHAQIPEVVDAWGAPVLVWMQNSVASGPINVPSDFARDQWAINNPAARFYWNSNSAMLSEMPAIGDKRVRQDNLVPNGSILHASVPGKSISLVGLLGNPGSPKAFVTADPLPTILPSAARGSFAVHSAGLDGVYLGKLDRGGKRLSAPPMPVANTLYYGLNFRNADNSAILDANGNTKSVDVIDEFDDLVTWGS